MNMPPRKTPQGDDTPNMDYWMGQVDSTLAEIKKHLENLVSTNNTNWVENRVWRNTVDTKLSNLDVQMATAALERKTMGERMTAMEERLCPLGEACPVVSRRHDRVPSMPASQETPTQPIKPPEDEEKDAVTFRWLLEKLWPVGLAMLTYLLLDLIPQLIRHLGEVP